MPSYFSILFQLVVKNIVKNVPVPIFSLWKIAFLLSVPTPADEKLMRIRIHIPVQNVQMSVPVLLITDTGTSTVLDSFTGTFFRQTKILLKNPT